MFDRNNTVTIFMPTLNEIDGIKAIFPRISREWYDELVVIDGGSTDGTVEWLIEKGIDVRQETRRGVVNAYCQGFNETKGNIFITFTPDGNCLPELIPELIRKIEEGYDVVFASRYLPPAKSYDDHFISGLGNLLFTKLVNLLFKSSYTDVLGGYRAYKRTAVKKMGLNKQPDENIFTKNYDLLNTWEVGGCIRAAKLGLLIAEIPGDEPQRIGGVSKISILYNGFMIVVQIGYELFTGHKYIDRYKNL